MSSDGSNLPANPADWITQPGKAFGNLIKNITPIATLGLAEYDPRSGGASGFRLGPDFQLVDETLGELTGRNLAREEMHKSEERLLAEDQTKQQQMIDEEKRKEQQDILASGTAQAIRNTSGARSNRTTNFNTLNTGMVDYLGL